MSACASTRYMHLAASTAMAEPTKENNRSSIRKGRSIHVVTELLSPRESNTVPPGSPPSPVREHDQEDGERQGPVTSRQDGFLNQIRLTRQQVSPSALAKDRPAARVPCFRGRSRAGSSASSSGAAKACQP